MKQDMTQLTLYPVDSHASHSRQQANKKEPTTTDIYGLKCFGLSKNSNQGGLLAKTSMDCYQNALTKYLGVSLQDWKKRDITQECSVMRLRKWVPIIDGEERSLWPTPLASAAKNYTIPPSEVKRMGSIAGEVIRRGLVAAGKNQAQRHGYYLNHDFIGWLMGFPYGWTYKLKAQSQIKAYGNAVVPQQAFPIFAAIVEVEKGIQDAKNNATN